MNVRQYRMQLKIYVYILQETQELSKTSLLAKEYFISTHWNATTIFTTINNILPYKETDSISGSIEKSIYLINSLINYLLIDIPLLVLESCNLCIFIFQHHSRKIMQQLTIPTIRKDLYLTVHQLFY